MNPFNLELVLPRVDLEPSSRIEVLELKVGILYVGTTDGWLLQYGLVERRDQHGNQVLTTSFIQRKQIGEKSKITFIHASPVINSILVVCNGNLHILNMSDLSPKSVPGAQKLKGISVCSVNQANPDQFRLQFCLAKKKQISLYSLDEEKLTLLRSREVGEPIVNLCVDGDTVCAALPTRYILLWLESGRVLDLFPVEESSLSLTITRVQDQEFLLAGPGNLGMFVTSEGMSVRPPVQWTANLYRIIYNYPYIIGLSPESIMIYSISDQRLKQGIPFPGGRTIGAFDGTILIAGSNQVSALLPVPWQVQAGKLVEKESVDEVLHLIESVTSTTNLTMELTQEIQTLRQRCGFICLARGEMSRASELLMTGKTDVRELLSLYPGMLSASSCFIRQSPPLHNIPDIHSVQPNQGEPSTISFLVQFLTNLIEMSEYCPDQPEDVFTALAKLLSEHEPAKFAAFLAQDTIVLHHQELIEFLSARGLLHFQALLQDKFGEEEPAFTIWSSLVQQEESDPLFPGNEFYSRKLTCSSERLMWSYIDALLKSDQKLAAATLNKHQNSAEPDFVDKSLNILNNYKEARKIFLQVLVLEKDSQVEKHHTLLAMLLIESHDSPEDLEKLRKLILSSTHLNTQFLLDKLEETDLMYERAILHGRLKQYDRALDILVNKMKDHSLAIRFCDDIAEGKQTQEKERILFLLLSTYLNPATEESKETFLVKAVDLINTRAADLNPNQVLAVLPVDWNIATILPAIKVFIRHKSHAMKMAKITKNLSKVENITVKGEYVGLANSPIHVLPNNYCVICKKGFQGTSVARYPNGILLHEHCIVNKQICPLTGQVFKLDVH